MLFIGSSVSFAQLPSVDDLWGNYVVALKADVAHNKKMKQRAEAEKQQQAINASIEEIKDCLSRPFEEQRVSMALGQISKLLQDPNLTDEKKAVVNKLDLLLNGYSAQAEHFCEVFVDSINDEHFDIWLKNPIPSNIIKMAGAFKKEYENRGLNKLYFEIDYVYLNEKLKMLKSSITALTSGKSNGTQKELYEMLQSVLKIESEISENHKTYYRLP